MKKVDLQSFFKLRMTELYNKATLDSYRVRSNNAMTLLYELRNVVDKWHKGNVKRFDTVKYCLTETLQELKDDTCIDTDFLPLSVFEDMAKSYIARESVGNPPKDEQDALRLIYYINKYIEFNEQRYVSNLISVIESYIFGEEEIDLSELSKLDKVLTAFGGELIRIGYSKIYLYQFFKKILKNEKGLDFNDVFGGMKEKFTQKRLQDYTVVFRMNYHSENKQIKASEAFPEFQDALPEEFFNAAGHIKSLQPSTRRYFINEVAALDRISAIKKTREKLSSILDTRQLMIYNVEIPYNAFVFCKNEDGSCQYWNATAYNLDVSYSQDVAYPEHLVGAISRLDSIDKGSRDRIHSALRHLRIGDCQTEMEQKFINYWIGLEFIFSSSASDESTFKRLSKNLRTILSCIYARRNIIYINERISTLLKESISFETLSEDEIDSLYERIPNLLMQYRVKELKRHFHHSDKTAKYIKAHQEHLEQHIERLYRLRNELIHEAAIKQGIENTTSNLRYYLTTIINLCLGYFSQENFSQDPRTMENFFWEYEYWWDLIKAKNYSKDILMRVPYNISFLR